MDKTVTLCGEHSLKSTCNFIHVEEQEVCSSKDEIAESFRTVNEKFAKCSIMRYHHFEVVCSLL